MKLHNLTVCDQVRQEINGKFLLIGVYTNGIVLPQIPTTFPLGVWLLLECDRLGIIKFKFRARMPEHNVELLYIEGEADIVDVENWTPIAFGSNVVISQPGSLTIEAMLNEEEEWQTLRTLHVKEGPIPGLGPSPLS